MRRSVIYRPLTPPVEHLKPWPSHHARRKETAARGRDVATPAFMRTIGVALTIMLAGVILTAHADQLEADQQLGCGASLGAAVLATGSSFLALRAWVFRIGVFLLSAAALGGAWLSIDLTVSALPATTHFGSGPLLDTAVTHSSRTGDSIHYRR